MATGKCNDSVILGQWHPLGSLDETVPDRVHGTMLLEERVSFGTDGNGNAYAWRQDDRLPKGSVLAVRDLPDLLPALVAHGYIWTSLGQPPEALFSFDEYYEDDRTNVTTGVLGVGVSPGRAIENFLDMGHFPYVHAGILGEEPHTEVREYEVEVSETRDEILATQCRFYQPRAAVASGGGAMVDYVYRVPHLNCALLYKSSPNHQSRKDVIYMFLQPVREERVRAHTGMCVIDDESSRGSIRHFQQIIFGQDKPILENQRPGCLPLDPRAETPIRADKLAIAYRRWLGRKGLRYGVIPAGSW